MAVPKKKRKNVNKSEFFKWTTARKAAARLISTGMKTQKEVSLALNLTEKTLSEWKQYPDFICEIERLTYLQERATRAGIVRGVLKAINIKEAYIESDRDTFLDYMEFMIKIIPPDTKSSDDKLKALTDAIMLSSRES